MYRIIWPELGCGGTSAIICVIHCFYFSQLKGLKYEIHFQYINPHCVLWPWSAAFNLYLPYNLGLSICSLLCHNLLVLDVRKWRLIYYIAWLQNIETDIGHIYCCVGDYVLVTAVYLRSCVNPNFIVYVLSCLDLCCDQSWRAAWAAWSCMWRLLPCICCCCERVDDWYYQLHEDCWRLCFMLNNNTYC